MRFLYLGNNKITEIKGLDSLDNIDTLNLAHNQITKIKSLENLITLRNLNLTYNQITELKGINGLLNLYDFEVFKNPITKIHLIKDVPNLRSIFFIDASVFSHQEVQEIGRWCREHGLSMDCRGEELDGYHYDAIVIGLGDDSEGM